MMRGIVKYAAVQFVPILRGEPVSVAEEVFTVRMKTLSTALTDEPIHHPGVLSIHTPCPLFGDVIFVRELNY